MTLAQPGRSAYSNRMTQWIFKILRPRERQEAAGNPNYPGSSADINDGFIHFSTAEQMEGTASKHFSDTDSIQVLAFRSDCWAAASLKWEPSRGGALFPHLYGPLDIALAENEWTIERNANGAFDLDPAINWVTNHV